MAPEVLIQSFHLLSGVQPGDLGIWGPDANIQSLGSNI